MTHLFQTIRTMLVSLVGLFCFAILGGMILFYYYSKDLPKLDTLEDYNPPVVSEVFANDGIKIGEFWTEKRYLLSPKELPKGIIEAVVASEDDRFFEHKGIDYQGILRALIENLKAGHIVQGGSTITQQVTKSLLLTKEKKISRKIKEAILATRIEQKFSKEEILYLYLNQIFFGNRAYGVEAAAQNYFHKPAKELNIAETAMIAGLAKAPSIFTPFANAQRAKTRQEYVIDRMYTVGYITKEQAENAKKFPLKVYRAETDKEYNNKYASWFTEHVRRMVQEKYGEQVPYTHGLKIETTLDLTMQKAADLAARKGLLELDKRQGYQGPLKKIQAVDFKTFTDAEHLSIIKKTEEIDQDPFHMPVDSELLTKPTPLDDAAFYHALITNVDRQNQNLEVLVGHQKGIIRVHDYTWARKRNTNASAYNDVYYVRDPAGTFETGDVILVKKKIIKPEVAKTKGYQDGITYFSLEQEPEAEVALFSYEPSSGFVKAMVGGYDFKRSEFNRATQALRQTGSVFKPFLYSAALDKGYTSSTIIEDAPIYYEFSPGRFWSPQNYGGGYKGPTSFRNALVNSRNVVSVRILMDVGTDYVAAYIRKLGISTPTQRYYSMALGANDMKLNEVARAFGTFPTGGILPENIYITHMTDRYGRVLEEYKPKQIVPFTEQIKNNQNNSQVSNSKGYDEDLLKDGEEWIKKEKLGLSDVEKRILYGDYIPKGYAISPRTAYMMVSLMNDIVNYGTGYKIKELKRPAAGKTGTTNDETDTWFIGYVPNLVAGVWVGFDQVKKIGGRETGGKTAAPIFLYYMQEALKGKPVAEFNIPQEINADSLNAPIDLGGDDAEAGGITAPGSGAEFFIYDF